MTKFTITVRTSGLLKHVTSIAFDAYYMQRGLTADWAIMHVTLRSLGPHQHGVVVQFRGPGNHTHELAALRRSIARYLGCDVRCVSTYVRSLASPRKRPLRRNRKSR